MALDIVRNLAFVGLSYGVRSTRALGDRIWLLFLVLMTFAFFTGRLVDLLWVGAAVDKGWGRS